MDAALLDGSDAQDRGASSHSERCAALKSHLHHVVLILESFNQTSRDNLKQDEQYNDLANRFISAFTSSPLPDLVSQVDQNGLKGITIASSTKPAFNGVAPLDTPVPPKRTTGKQRLPSTSALSSILPSVPIPSSGLGKTRGNPTVTTLRATIHFLVGNTNCTTGQITTLVNRALTTLKGRVEYVGYTYQGPIFTVVESAKMTLKWSGPSKPILHALKAANLSSLWTRGAVTYIREEGTISYGLRVSTATNLGQPFLNPKTIGNPLLSRNVRSELVSEINEVYLQRSNSDLGDIAVSDSLGDGIYMFSGPRAQDLENIVAEGKKTVSFFISQYPVLGRSFEVVIEPFRLSDYDSYKMHLSTSPS